MATSGLSQQLIVQNSPPYDDPVYLVKYIFLSGSLPVSNISYTGAYQPDGRPIQLGYFTGPGTGLGMDAGLILSNGHIYNAQADSDPNNAPNFGGGGWTLQADPDVTSLVTGANSVCDVAYLRFSFTAVSDSVEFKYVFGSEEYPQNVCNDKNDAFGFFITGPGINGPYFSGGVNIAKVPGTNLNVSINTVNGGVSAVPPQFSLCPPGGLSNAQYYVPNPGEPYIEYHGYTTVLTAKAYVTCGETYHLKIAIVDGGDCSLDSGVFLEANSFTPWAIDYRLSQYLPGQKYIEGCEQEHIYFSRSNTDTAATLYYQVSGTATNGTDYTYLDGQVHFAVGQDLASILFEPLADGLTEGIDTVIISIFNISSCGDTIPSEITLLIRDEFAVPVTVTNDSSNCPGDSVFLSASGPGAWNYTYLWSTGDTLQTIGLAPLFSDSFLVTITDTRGCKGRGYAYVGVSRFATDAGADTAVCYGDTVMLGGNPAGPPGATYMWQPDPKLLGALNQPQQTALIEANHVFYLNVTDSLNCTITDSVLVSVLPLPVLQTGGDSLWLCPGASLQLQATGAQLYSWSPAVWLNDSTLSNPIATPPDTITYVLSGIDSNTCKSQVSVTILVNGEVPTFAGVDTAFCFGDSVTLGGAPTAPAGSSYQWFNWAIDNPANANPMVSPPTDTVFWVLTQNDTCTGVDSVWLHVLPLPVVQASADTGLCRGDTVLIFATGAQSYLWLGDSMVIANPGQAATAVYPSQTSLFIVEGTDSNTCQNSDSVFITVFDLPVADAGSDTTVCEDIPYQMGNVPNSGITNYTWNPTTQLSDPQVANPMFSGTEDMDYVLIVTDTNTCSSSDTVKILVFRLLPVGDTAICAEDTLRISYFTENGFADFYTLNQADTVSTLPQPAFYFAGENQVNLDIVAISLSGCESTGSFTISANPLPVDSFYFEGQPYCDGMQVYLEYTDPDLVQAIWQIGGVNYTDNPLSIWLSNASLSGVLLAENTFNCKREIVLFGKVVNSGEQLGLEVPNVFTPNGDGINDFFEIPLPEGLYACSNLKVYNRWGGLIYDSNGFALSWNGRLFSGEEVLEGTYFYVLNINGYETKGYVQLIR